MSNKFLFTKDAIDALPLPDKERIEYFDTKEKSLQLRVSKTGIKTFRWVRHIKGQGKTDSITIGRITDIGINTARKKCEEYNLTMVLGTNPNDAKRNKQSQITLKELYENFMEDWADPHLKPKTVAGYRSTYKTHLSSHPIINSKICDISTHHVAKLFNFAGKSSPVAANRLLALLSSIFNKAIKWGIYDKNPCTKIEKFPEQSRDRSLQPGEIPKFFNALKKVKNEIHRDFFYTKLFVGNRRAKVLAMHQSNLDLINGIWLIPTTKNRRPHAVSLTHDVVNCISTRIKRNIELGFTKENGFNENWIFPSARSKSGHLEEPKKSWAALLRKAEINDLHLHDLRHTLGSYMNASGSDAMLIKSMLGHDDIKSTQIYVHPRSEIVRQAAEKAQKAIMEFANPKSLCSAQVIYLTVYLKKYRIKNNYFMYQLCKHLTHQKMENDTKTSK